MLSNEVDQQGMRSPLHFMKGQRSKFSDDGDVGLMITEISHSCYLNSVSYTHLRAHET